jgi:hypothetical protein
VRFASALLVSGGVACGVSTFTARTAAADCVAVYVGLTWTNGSTTSATPWAEGTCLVPTPFPTVSSPSGGGHDDNLPPNPPHPNGYRWSANVVMA